MLRAKLRRNRRRRTGAFRIAFLARVPDPGMLERVGFYSADIKALRAAGAEVLPVTRLRRLPWRADAYFVWWWTHALPVVVWGRLTRRPVLITGTMHWGASAEDDGYAHRPWYQRQVMAWSVRLATRNLCVSRCEMDGMARGLGGTNFSYYPHSVELPALDEAGRSDRVEELFATVKEAVLVLSMSWSGARNLRRKCIYELVEAFELVADRGVEAHLVLCGNRGDGEQTLRERVATSRHSAKVHFLGEITEPEKGHLFRRADVMASPSRFEGFGVAIAEAAALGVPVLTSPVGAVPEVLGDGAVFCDGADVEDIALGLWRLAADAGLRTDVARRGRAAAGRFTQAAKNELTRDYLREYVGFADASGT